MDGASKRRSGWFPRDRRPPKVFAQSPGGASIGRVFFLAKAPKWWLSFGFPFKPMNHEVPPKADRRISSGLPLGVLTGDHLGRDLPEDLRLLRPATRPWFI